MKNYQFRMIVLLLLFLPIFGCHKDKQTTEINIERILDNLFKPSAESVALLAAKYNIEPLQILSIIEDFNPKPGSQTADQLLKQMDESYDTTLQLIGKKIDLLSSKFAVPRAILASILIDYQMSKSHE